VLLSISLTTPLGWVIPLVCGFVVALGLTPLAARVAVRAGIIDRPIGDKIHKRATPLMGGVAVYLAFAATVILVLPVRGAIAGVLVGGLAAVTVGVLDEKLGLPPLLHLLGQIGVAVAAMAAGVGVVHTLNLPWSSLTTPGTALPFWIGAALTLFWLVGMMNTMNFLDGLDGLAAGIAALSAGLLAVWASEPKRFFLPSGHHEYVVLPVVLVGALLGFLVYNWHPARVFLGDSGSMFLGLTIGALSIVGPAKLGTALLVLVIPVLDVGWAIVRRQMQGRSFLAGDKQHVYHRMLDLGLDHTTTVLLLYFLCFVLAALDLFLFRLAKLVAFLLLAVATGSAFVVLEVRAARRADMRRTYAGSSTRLPPGPNPAPETPPAGTVLPGRAERGRIPPGVS
jgi:UDP-GlcNAc:undecaprenyl-phosphate GlcNAc-1-phosphate transferase